MCVKPLCLLMSTQCLTCSLRKILFSVNLFVNLFVRQVCSFRLECFERHVKWLFEFNSWSTALWCMCTYKFYSCSHFLCVTVWEILNLLQCLLSCNSKTLQLSVFAVRQFEVEHMLQHVFLFCSFAHNLPCSRFVNCCMNLCKILLCICQLWFSCSSSHLTSIIQFVCPICWLSRIIAQRTFTDIDFYRSF